MVVVPDQADNVTFALDAIAQDLQKLRFDAGQVTYSELASRIEQMRLAEGAIPAAASVARSTVYDAFRNGRKRVNADLIVEIVRALGATESEASMWRDRCYEASRASPAAPSVGKEPSFVPDIHVQRVMRIVMLMCCVGVNIFGNTIAEKFALPLFLDMTGTAVAALVFGPWSGVLVALATGVATSLSGSPQSLVFSLVAVAGALVWGYGYHRCGMGGKWWQFLTLNLSVAVICSLVAAPLTVLIYGGTVSHASSSTTAHMFALGYGAWAAVFFGNLASSVADKILTGYVALFVERKLPQQVRQYLSSKSDFG